VGGWSGGGGGGGGGRVRASDWGGLGAAGQPVCVIGCRLDPLLRRARIRVLRFLRHLQPWRGKTVEDTPPEGGGRRRRPSLAPAIARDAWRCVARARARRRIASLVLCSRPTIASPEISPVDHVDLGVHVHAPKHLGGLTLVRRLLLLPALEAAHRRKHRGRGARLSWLRGARWTWWVGGGSRFWLHRGQ